MYHLTTPQQNIWNLQKTFPKTSISNLCGAVFWGRRINVEIVRKALNKFIELQAGMRLQFEERNGETCQYTAEYTEQVFSYLSFDDYTSFERYAQEFAQTPFEMKNSPMYHFVIFELNGTSGVLACLNHLIADAWTFSLLAKGVWSHCLELESGSVSEHETYDYVDYIEAEQKYLESERCQKDMEYWTEVYAERPDLCPIKLISTPITMPTAQRFTTILTPEQTARINTFCTENSVSQAVLFETAVFVYLSKVNRENKCITIGVPVLNRKTRNDKSTVGMYISTTPLTIDISAEDSASVLSERITEAHSRLFRHQKYPYSNILTEVRRKHQFDGNLYDVIVSFQNAKTEEDITTKWFSNGFSEIPFSLHIDNRDSADSYTLNVDYQTEVFRHEEEISMLVDRLMLIINQIIENQQITVGEISIIPEDEYQKVIFDFNDTAVEYPRDKCVHELFSEQAARTPEKIALVFEDKKFTYKQLDEMSNSLAHYLREEKSIQPNDIVPIIAKRSWYVVVAMLGVLKAGGAYMPVDPSYPTDRIEYMLTEVSAETALVCGYTESLSIQALDLEAFDYDSHHTVITNVNYAEDKCYVLFTSGTTGKPKAAIVTHHNLGNFVNDNNNNLYQCNMLNTCKVVVATGTFTFDISVFEIYLSLLNGLTVIMANETENLSASMLSELIVKYDVDVIHSTPTKISMFFDDEAFQRASVHLKMMMVGAETFTEELRNKVKQYTDAVIYNGYGPTETTVAVSFKRITEHTCCIHDLFTRQAVMTPDKIALVFEDKKFTYRQLDEMSNSLAHYLREEKGIKPNNIVPIIAKRSWHIIVAMLSVLKAGGAYTLIDYSYPSDRIDYLIGLCRNKIVLTCGCEYVNSISLENFDFAKNISSITNRNQSSDLFCAIHTSGSTGTPKLTTLTHYNIAHYTNYAKKFFEETKQAISTTIITFDAFIQETIVALCNAVSIILCTEQEMTNQSSFENMVKQYNNSFLFQTPTKLLSYIRNSNDKKFISNISCFVIGGEIFPDELSFLISEHNPNCKVYNIYGPTETTICATTDDIIPEIDITIGKPIANTQIYILDKNRKPLPIGVAGELCISGDGVGKGYLNRPELTAEKFIPNPFYDEKTNPTAGKIMYCTGDLARWRVDGELEYLGRIDTQVKIRGLRIELGEIESVMSAFEGIRLTAVTDKRDENNRQYLVGYYTADKTIDEKALRQHLSAKLPKYMVPNYFVHLEEMPMTASGKTDRKNLPLPDFAASTNEYVTPETETEKAIAAIWSKLLKVENVGKTDDFYDLGGDSLMAISLLNHLENAFGTEITMKDILEHPVLESLAKRIASSERKMQKILATSSDKYTLLPQQKAIYAVCSKNPDTLTYNMPTRIPLDESIDREKIKKCFIQLIQKHSSLRTYISAEADDVFGIVDNDAYLTFEEYSDENYMDFVRPFDLSKAPLMRIGFTETAMLFDMHHIIADGESLNLILHDLTKLYFDEETAVNDVQYADYAAYFKKADFSEHKAFYKDMLKCDFEPTVLPERKHQSEAVGTSKMYHIDAKTFELAKKYAKAMGLTETMLFLGAYGILLSKYTAKSDVLSSIVLTNRIHRETQDVVGMFVNTLPVMMKADGTVSEYFANVKQLVLNLFAYQELPFFDATEAVGMADKSVINTSFVYQADGEKKLSIGSAELLPEFIDTHTSKFDLTFEMTPNENGCTVRIEYNSGKYEETLIDRLFAAFGRILNQLEKEKITDISVLSENEYQKVIFDFNDTAVEYPRDKCVHELFSEQAARTPEKIALVFEEEKFTYKQLDEMSNSLAHYLREEKGIKPNDIVPIIAKRSWHIIVAMLGVLKAGGAYMPVDPAYPIERIEYMVSEVNADIALVLGFDKCISVDIFDVADFDYNRNCSPIFNVNCSNHKCYSMFTSGTTGNPKAIVVTHQNLSNFVNNNNNNAYQFDMLKSCSTVLALTAYTFDISVFEIYLSLLNGLTVVMTNDDQNLSASQLAKLIDENKVDVIHSTPTKITMLFENDEFKAASKQLKMIMAGAETFTEEFNNKIKKYTNAVVYNGYGPTETTIGVSFKRIDGSPYVIHELFRRQVSKTPEKITLVFEDNKFTYKQLDEMSNSLANYLREENNIQPNDIVPIIAKRSWHIIVAMLGVLKAGGAYMPVDPSYPIDRIEYMLEEANAKIALTFGYEGELGIKSIELENFDYSSEPEPIENLNTPNDLCYLIFTSGSTGKPKGTMLTHANVRNYAHNNNNNVVRKIIKESYESILSVTNIVFDIFVTESILAVLNGLTIYFASDDEVVSQEKLAALIQNNAVDVMQTTPTKMRGYMLDKDNLAYLRKLKTIILGGEALTSDLYQELTEYTDAEIYNIYGPAETTVWSTNSHVENIDITIGKPIANTQIYILDQNRNPLPIGVAGELCISGDGVGKGYLNRPELTAEKFIPNPFIEGKTMYCTGDLARWRVDGELEYLGRIDTQVKIRGLRIELGEIESVMSSFDGIRLTAVTDKRDENNRQYLVGYYTAETEIDEKALRQHLSAKLPKYMVPNYFVHLEEMPMTASGKTDRKNLPLPDFAASTNEYIAPETETELKLCNLIAQLFGIEKVGVTDDFFDIGGDSLKAIEYIAKAHNIGIEIGLQDVFDYPTVRELCEHFTHGSETEMLYKQEDFEKYQELLRQNVLNDNFVPEKKSLGNILLTGATGFLGAHVLDALLREESGKIYCLVRGGAEKLVEMLNYYFGEQYDAEIGKRILPVVGDITNPDLSLDIPNDVHTVIHTAASVKHYGSYQYFHDINVQGTQNVVNYAKQIGAKLIHISTISVSGNSFADAFTVYRSEEEKHFDEQSLFIEQEFDNVYVRSKFEAEMAVLDAALDGLDAKIIRVGNLTNRASDFMFQPNYAQNAFLTRIKAALEFGKLPEYLMPWYAEFSPIDETAEGVIRIAQYAEEQNVFHLNSNRPIYFTRLLEVLKALEIPMEVVSGTEFGRLLQEYAKHSETEYIYEAFQNDMDENGNLVYDSNIRIINNFTVQFLKRVGFEWTQIDFEYIKGYVEYFRGFGYLEV